MSVAGDLRIERFDLQADLIGPCWRSEQTRPDDRGVICSTRVWFGGSFGVISGSIACTRKGTCAVDAPNRGKCKPPLLALDLDVPSGAVQLQGGALCGVIVRSTYRSNPGPANSQFICVKLALVQGSLSGPITPCAVGNTGSEPAATIGAPFQTTLFAGFFADHACARLCE